MFKISEIYKNNKSDKIQILKEGDMFCLELDGVKSADSYDNIFAYGENLFVLVSKGNFGAVQYDESLNEIWRLPCEYSTLDEYYHNLIFSKKDGCVYYNASDKARYILKDANVEDGFVYGENEEMYLIIEMATGEVIWSEEKNNKVIKCRPCYVFCGKADGKSVFYDIANADYITKNSDGYARVRNLPILKKPIIVNGVNVVNVCWENGKIGRVDEANKRVLKPRWNEISVELKVTYRGGAEQREEVFSVADIKAEDVIPIETW